MRRKICPSAFIDEANLLLGIVSSEGKVDFLGKPIRIDNHFKEIARGGRTPEKRFRFASSCIKSKCSNWENQQCNVSTEISSVENEYDRTAPICGIKDACRWASQDGEQACLNCKFVITDTT